MLFRRMLLRAALPLGASFALACRGEQAPITAPAASRADGPVLVTRGLAFDPNDASRPSGMAAAPMGHPQGWVEPSQPARASITSVMTGGLTIVPTFDANVSGAAQTAIANALAPYSALFSNPQTFGIKFYDMSTGLGQSHFFIYGVSYATFRSAWAASATSTDDAAAVANTPTTSVAPVPLDGSSSSVFLKPALGRTLGLNTPDVAFTTGNCAGYTGIGCIGINVTLANAHGDLAAVVQHEVNEVLGLGSALSDVSTPPIAWAEDLFRWASPGVRSFAPNASSAVPCTSTPRAYFSIDGGATAINDFNNCANGGDYGDWITHTPSQIQDAFTNFSGSPSMTAGLTEVRALDVVGYTLATGGTPATMTSPTPGSTLGSSSVTFQWDAGTGTRYWLDIGTTVGGTDIYSVDQGAAHSVGVTGLPSNGRTVYVRLWTFTSGTWAFHDYTYVSVTNAGTKAAMTSPAPGSTLAGSTVNFQWSAGTGTRYWLDIGTTVGGTEIYSVDQGAGLSVSVAGLPSNGSTVYVRLWTFLNGGWVSTDYTYTAATSTGTKAVMTSPANGSTLPGSTVTFQWSAGTGTRYWLDIGTTVGGNNLYSADRSANLNATVTGLPANGSTVYVRLWTFLNGGWVSNDYSYTAATSTGTKAVMTSPANGSTLPGSTVTFQWSAGTGTRYWLDIGTSVGANNLYSADRGANLSATVTSLPTNGSTVYVRLWTFLNGSWVSNDYTYTAGSSVGTKATMTSPANGSTFGGATAVFQWNGGTGTRYWLDIGTTVGGNDLFSADRGANLNATAGGLPTDGRTLYVRLWTFLNGSWVSNDYVYTAATASKAVMTSPLPGTTLSGSTANFQWTAGQGTRYWIDLGTSVGANNLYSADRSANLNATISGIPTDGRTLYVRLWTFLNGAWVSNDYTYTTGP